MKAYEDKKFCSSHPDKPAVTSCNICGKLLCQECLQRFGYFCSIECKNQSLSSINKDEQIAKNIEEQKMSKFLFVFKVVFFSLIVIISILIAVYIFSIFFSSSGKLAWNYRFNKTYGDAEVLSADDNKIIIKAWNRILHFSSDGKLLFEKELPDYAKYSEKSELVIDGKIIVQNSGKLTCFDFNGEKLWQLILENKSNNLYSNHEKIFIAHLLPDYKVSFEEPLSPSGQFLQSEIKTFDSVSGKELNPEMEIKSNHLKILCANSKYFAIQTSHSKITSDDSLGALNIISIWRIDKSKELFRIKSETNANFATFTDKVFLFNLDDTINAVSLSNGKKLWAYKLNSKYTSLIKTIKILPDYFLLKTPQKIISIRDSDGSEKWSFKTDFSDDNFVIDEKNIYILHYENGSYNSAQKNDNQNELPLNIEQLDRKQIMSEISNNPSKSFAKLIPVLSCIDIENGVELWRQTDIRGEILLSGNIIVVVYDTALSPIMAMSPEAGETIISAYDKKNGKMIFSRKSKIGFCKPYFAISSKLYGFEFSRESSYKRKFQSNDGRDGEEGNISGLLCFYLK